MSMDRDDGNGSSVVCSKVMAAGLANVTALPGTAFPPSLIFWTWDVHVWKVWVMEGVLCISHLQPTCFIRKHPRVKWAYHCGSAEQDSASVLRAPQDRCL